jgi:hypothetical protein
LVVCYNQKALEFLLLEGGLDLSGQDGSGTTAEIHD